VFGFCLISLLRACLPPQNGAVYSIENLIMVCVSVWLNQHVNDLFIPAENACNLMNCDQNFGCSYPFSGLLQPSFNNLEMHITLENNTSLVVDFLV
jgi:hypothetical protein